MTERTAPVRAREIFGWAMYDFANSSFTTVVITVVYAPFFTRAIATGPAPNSVWSLAIQIGTIATLLLSPLAGAIVDKAGRKKRFLLFSTAACASATAALYFVTPGGVVLGVLLIAISNAAFMLGEVFCASFLTELADRRSIGRISGLGWSLGYFGGLASLLLVGLFITADPDVDAIANANQTRIAMVVTGAFFALAAIPTFVLVRERARPAPGFENASYGKLFRAGWSEMRATFSLVREHPVLFRFLLAFLVYMAGLYAIIAFVGIYAERELEMSLEDLTILFLVVQVSAALGAFGFGYLERWVGPKRTVLLTLGWWAFGVLSIYFLDSIANTIGIAPKTAFTALALVLGSAMGATQSSSRAMVGLLTPASRSAQMFGFWGSFARLSNLLGLTYGFAADAVGLRPALWLVVAFFGAGAILLVRVPVEEGIAAAECEG